MATNTSASRNISIASVTLSFMSVLLGVISFGLPYWIYFDDVIIVSISGTASNVRMKFHYGFWSYCNDVSTNTQSLNSCGPIKTHSDQEQLTICLVMLSIILSVNAFVNTCLFLLLMKNEKMCLYVTAASALTSGLLLAAADINYGVQDHTAKITSTYSLPFSLSNLSIAFWLSIANCIVISLSAVCTAIALYKYTDKDSVDDTSTLSSRQSHYRYEKEVPRDAVSVDNQSIYEDTPFKSRGYHVFEDESSDDGDDRDQRSLCVNTKGERQSELGDEISINSDTREPSLEIDDYTKQTEGYVSGVWSRLEKDNTMYEPSDTESHKSVFKDEKSSLRARSSNSGFGMKNTSVEKRDDVEQDRTDSLVNGSSSKYPNASPTIAEIDPTTSNAQPDILPSMNGNHEVFMLPNSSQQHVEDGVNQNIHGYFIEENGITNLETSSNVAIENKQFQSLIRPISQISAKSGGSVHSYVSIGQTKRCDLSTRGSRTMTPVNIDGTLVPHERNEVLATDHSTIHNDLDSLAGSRPSLRDYPDALSIVSRSGQPPLDTRIQPIVNDDFAETADKQIKREDNQFIPDGLINIKTDIISDRDHILDNKTMDADRHVIDNNTEVFNGEQSSAPMCGQFAGIENGGYQAKSIDIDLAAISEVPIDESQNTQPMNSGYISDPKSQDTIGKPTKRKKIAIQFNITPPVSYDDHSTVAKVKTVRKVPIGRDRKHGSARQKQRNTSRPQTAKSLTKPSKREEAVVFDEDNPYSRPGTAVKVEEGRIMKDNSEVKLLPKKELVKKAAYKRLKQTYQCKLPRMYSIERQEIFRKLAKVHTESSTMRQDSVKNAGSQSPSLRPKTSKRRLSPSPSRAKPRHLELNKQGEDSWFDEEFGTVSEV